MELTHFGVLVLCPDMVDSGGYRWASQSQGRGFEPLSHHQNPLDNDPESASYFTNEMG
jgi:hypothetical protein